MDSKKANLKLLVKSVDDVNTISAYLQDSLISVKNIKYLKKSNIFLMMCRRFMWEDVEKGTYRKNKRIKSVVKFDKVIKVISKNINQKKNKILGLLTVKAVLKSEDIYEIQVIFSGNSIITIYAEEISCLLDDVGNPWIVKLQPKHKV
jgi:hypothetical protein